MNPEDFKDSPAGRLVPTIHGCMAFVPHPLPPPPLDLAHLAIPLEKANLAVGELNGIARTLPNPYLLMRPFMRVEAIASSKIEGTVTTLPELLMLEAGQDDSRARNDTKEVRNYQTALRYGLEQLPNLPVSSRLMSEMHVRLMDGVSPARGALIRPGEFKRDQNWIGARTIQNARFVPPPPAEAIDALSDLEKYIHSDDGNPLLVRLALIHYQFETIHPFPDRNGRIGRLLIPLLLSERKVMNQPLLYISSYFERHYDEYIDGLYEVSRRGAWNSWIRFFLEGVAAAGRDAIEKGAALQDLRKRYLQKVQAARSSALLAKLIDSLFAVPATTIGDARDELGISYNAAKNNIRRLVDLSILSPGADDERPQYFFATEIINVVY